MAGLRKYSHKKSKTISWIAVGVSLLLGVIFFMMFNFVHVYTDELEYATCTSYGTVSHVCQICGKRVEDSEKLVPPRGHDFSEWKTVTAAEIKKTGEESRHCNDCNFEEKREVVVDLGMPIIQISTDFDKLESNWADAHMSFRFVDGENDLSYDGYISRQKTSAEDSQKYNYKITLGNSSDDSVDLCGLGESRYYSLVANYLDYTMLRNMLSASLYNDIANTYGEGEFNEHILNLPNNCGIDSDPVMLYINGEYKGIYSLCAYRYDKLYSFGDFIHSSMLYASERTDSTCFKKENSAVYDYGWDIKYYNKAVNNPGSVVRDLNDLIKFVIHNDGEAFVNGIDKYLDVDAAIDYLLNVYFMGASENCDKGMLWLTYDGKQWFCITFDVYVSFGLSPDGTKIVGADEFMPYIDNNTQKIYSGTNMLLWDRLLNNFGDRIVARYEELREEVFTSDNVESILKELSSEINKDAYDVESEIWPDIPSIGITDVDQIIGYVEERVALLDSFFNSIK